jgi:cytochrome c oxidase subunit 2
MLLKAVVRTLCAAIFITVSSAHSMTGSQTSPRQINVTAKRYTFEPGEITLRKGEPVLIVITSTDVAHGLRFPEFNAEVNVRARGTARMQFTPDSAGDFIGHCSVFCGSGHGSMRLMLHVVN